MYNAPSRGSIDVLNNHFKKSDSNVVTERLEMDPSNKNGHIKFSNQMKRIAVDTFKGASLVKLNLSNNKIDLIDGIAFTIHKIDEFETH